jgi:hypothetical protein
VRHELGARIEELAEIDPQAELLALVKRLIAASEAEPANTALARELRNCLAVLTRAEELDPVQARQASVAARLAAMSAGLPGNVARLERPGVGGAQGTGNRY